MDFACLPATNSLDIIRILYVDDDSLSLSLLKEILEAETNFKIDTALSVDEASNKLLSNEYDIIISDYEMPQTNGLQFLQKLREQKNKTPFILYTGRGREEVAITALNLGADRYINKQGEPETVYGELSHYIRQIAEKRKVEQCLKQEEERLVKVSSQMFGFLFQLKLSPDGSFTIPFATNGIKEIFGCTPAEVKLDFSPIAKVIHPQDYERLIGLVEKSAKMLSPLAYECRVQIPSQPLKWIYSKSIPEKQADGSIIWSGSSYDITDQKQLEQELIKSKTLLSETELAGNIGGWEIDIPTLARKWTDQTLRILEIEPTVNELSVADGLKFVNPPYRELANKAIQRAIDYGEPYDQEWEITTQKGNKRWVHSTGKVKIQNGKVTTVYGSIQDITERKIAETQLRESEERLRLKLESVLSPDANISEHELSNIIDLPKLQEVMDNLNELTQTPFAIIDLKGNVLVKSGWQDICTKFHRIHPQTLKNCIESDMKLTHGVNQDEYRLYKCKNNLYDVAMPLILNDKQVGNIYFGQLFFEDEHIDRDVFAAQAEKYGFNKEEYLSALDRVPKYSREKIQKLIHFTMKLSELISKLSFSNLKLAKALSDQKAAELEISANQKRWATTLSSIGDAVIATDKKGTITYMNPEAEKLTGWHLTEAKQKPIHEIFNIINEKTRQPVENPVDRVIQEGIVVGLANHTILICKDKKEVPIADSGAPIKDEAGNITGVVLVFRDVTELSKMQKEIEQLAKFPIENTEPVIRLSSTGKILFANPASRKLLSDLHLEVDSIVPETWRTYLQDAINSKQAIYFQNNHVGRDFQFRIVPITSEGYANLYATDITELKNAEASLVLNRIMLESLLTINKMTTASEKELLDYAIEAITKVTVSEYAFIGLLNDNETIMTLHSWSKTTMDQCKTTTNPIHYPISQAGLWSEPIKQRKTILIDDYKTASYNKKGLPDGHVQIKNYLGVPIFEENHIVVIAAVANKTSPYTQNDIHIITSIINDMWRMIQRKKFEHEREQNISKLTVMNEKLRIIGNLTRHNVGNKLSAIETNAYLLRKHIDQNSEVTKYFDSINSIIASSRRLFEYSYHYSRIGIEKLSNINVEKCFNEIIPHFTTLKNIKVSNQTNGLTVVADSLLTQVFYNLIENSLKHGQKVTHIKLTYKKQKETNQIQMIYEDDGVGIPIENKSFLYTEGFSTAKSTGLGLPLTKKIVEFYGWTLTEQGTPGNGAKFIITIPTKQP